MGTPINQFVRRFLSPNLAPKKLFTSPRSPLSCSKTIQVQKRDINFVKSLKFNTSPLKSENLTENFLGVQPFYENPEKYEIIKFEKKSPKLSVDTPDRNDLMKYGLENKKMAVLGRGKFGTVVLAKYKGQKVAIKIANQNKTNFQNEKNALKLKHKNIVKVLKVVFEPDKNYGIVIMEHILEAQNLYEILKNEYFPISKNTILKWALDIVKGVMYCHENGILHLDIKPKNILVGEDDICRICDFGNSSRISQRSKVENLGTIYYTAPEIFQDLLPTEKSDVYSLGITFWEMENRKIPYEDIDCHEIIIYEVVKNGLRPKIPRYESDLTKIYVCCWSPNPDDRPSLLEIEEELLEKYSSFLRLAS